MNTIQYLRQWGNGTGVRLPKKMLDMAKLQSGQSVSVSLKGRSIVLTPADDEATLTLDDLLNNAASQQMEAEIEWGPNIGREVYD